MAHRFFNEKALAVAAPSDLANELEARLPPAACRPPEPPNAA
jgi:hypothetical protein